MIDKIFADIMQEARSRKGHDFSLKLCSVVQELDVKIMDKFAELNEHFMDWIPDDPEELGKVKDSAFLKEVKKRYDRGNI